MFFYFEIFSFDFSVSSETNAILLKNLDVKLYQREGDALSAEWSYADNDSVVTDMGYAISTFPGGEDVWASTSLPVLTGDGSLPSSPVYLDTLGEFAVCFLHLHQIVGVLYFHCSLSVCVCLSVCV